VNKYGANNIDGLTIGNEVADTPMNIMTKVWDVRGYLNNVIGYKGPISTVPTWVEVMNNPVLCDADRVTVNAYAFFDGNVKAGARVISSETLSFPTSGGSVGRILR
jgi:exo-beta-1,3-glucanase (GH17 family)